MALRPLTTSFAEKGFLYTQKQRVGMVAIYEQRRIESGRCCYEVIVIQAHKETTYPNGTVAPVSSLYSDV